MKQSPSRESNSRLSSQKFPRPSWNQEVYYRVCKNAPLVPILSQIISSTPSQHISKIGFNIILQSKI
jgi:hypothetical protein